jgi:hypothetical protein
MWRGAVFSACGRDRVRRVLRAASLVVWAALGRAILPPIPQPPRYMEGFPAWQFSIKIIFYAANISYHHNYLLSLSQRHCGSSGLGSPDKQNASPLTSTKSCDAPLYDTNRALPLEST